MSVATLERAILAQARIDVRNPKLLKNDLLEWSTSPLKAECESEVSLSLGGDLGVYVTIPKACDHRPQAKGLQDSTAATEEPQP